MKTLDAELAETDSRGWAGMLADALREAKALNQMAGAVGVVGFRGIIITASNTIHILMEYVPWCPRTLLLKYVGEV